MDPDIDDALWRDEEDRRLWPPLPEGSGDHVVDFEERQFSW